MVVKKGVTSVLCPNCGQSVPIGDAYAGSFTCPKCKVGLTINRDSK